MSAYVAENKCYCADNRVCFFLQAEDGIRDSSVTGVQTCALPICARATASAVIRARPNDVEYTPARRMRSEEHTSELQSHLNLVCRLLLENKSGGEEKGRRTRHRNGARAGGGTADAHVKTEASGPAACLYIIKIDSTSSRSFFFKSPGARRFPLSSTPGRPSH